MNTLKNKWFKFIWVPEAKGKVIAILICLIFSALLGGFTPRLIQDIFGSYDDGKVFYFNLKLLIALGVGIYVNRVAYNFMVNYYVKDLIQRVRLHCYQSWIFAHDTINEKNKKAKNDFPMGEVMARIMSDSESVRELVTSGTFGIFIDLFFILSCLISFIGLHVKAGGLLIIAEVLAALALLWGSKYMAKVYMSVRRSTGKMSQTIANLSGGLKEMYYSNNGKYSSKKGKIVFDDFLNKQVMANVWDASYYSVAESLYPLFLLLLVATLPFTGIQDAALMAVMIDLIQRSISPIKEITGKIANLQRASTGFSRMNEFLSHLSKLPQSKGENLKTHDGLEKLDVKINSFSYPQKNDQEFSIQDIGFDALKGETIGIVGLSGSGKSTVLNILSGGIIPDLFSISYTSGEQSFGIDQNSTMVEYEAFRQQISLVSQDSHVFSDSLGFNLSMTADWGEELELFFSKHYESIPYLKSWGKDLNSQVKVGDLSVGQKQLISLLRVCYLKRPIVLLDEVSSGLDGELEESLRKVLKIIQARSITIVVAHRIETVIASDKIIVLDQGRLVSIGRHEELAKNSRLYQEFLAEIVKQ